MLKFYVDVTYVRGPIPKYGDFCHIFFYLINIILSQKLVDIIKQYFTLIWTQKIKSVGSIHIYKNYSKFKTAKMMSWCTVKCCVRQKITNIIFKNQLSVVIVFFVPKHDGIYCVLLVRNNLLQRHYHRVNIWSKS